MIICTNAYSRKNVDRHVVKDIIPVSTIQIATERPLTGQLAKALLPNGEVVSDTQHHLLYFRRDDAGRFLMGGAGAYTPLGLKRAFRLLRLRAC